MMPRSERRAEGLFRAALAHVHARQDRAFAMLMAAQWVFAIVLALVFSPYGWTGKVRAPHLHLYYAIFLGAFLNAPVFALTRLQPGAPITRHVVAASQMLWSALLIHLSGGRIETHFHVFGSLAFLAFYRDWRVLLTATVVVALDHLVRGVFWSESVYGVVNPEWWRFIEHASWVAFADVVLIIGTNHNLSEMRDLATRQAELEALNANIEQRVTERTEELVASREQYRSLVETTQTVPFQWDLVENRFKYVGPQGVTLLGCSLEQWLEPGFFEERTHPDDRAELEERSRGRDPRTMTGAQYEFRMRREDDTWVWVRAILNPVESPEVMVLTGVMLDVTERRILESEQRHSQKLEAVGRLASGVAHEINTPIQFVSDSVCFMREAFGDLLPLLDRYRALRDEVRNGSASARSIREIERAEEAADLPFLIDNLPSALARSSDGLGRVAEIVKAMKEFAHPDEQGKKTPTDLNRAIATTLVMAGNECKYVADVETDLGELPLVRCDAGALNQVFLNLIVNAAHAVSDVVKGTGKKGLIKVASRRDGRDVVVTISDTGAGIPEGVRGQIFDPFFTTKEVGKGTGQGLSIARTVVVDKHCGTIAFDSEVGRGTTFTIRLPIEAVDSREARTGRRRRVSTSTLRKVVTSTVRTGTRPG